MPQQRFDALADGVVREGAIEVFDEVGRGQVLDLEAGGDGGVPERDQGVGFTGPGRADHREVLLRADPLERGEVRPGRGRDRGRGKVELLDRLDDGEPGGLEPGSFVGGVAGGDLGLDQGP